MLELKPSSWGLGASREQLEASRQPEAAMSRPYSLSSALSTFDSRGIFVLSSFAAPKGHFPGRTRTETPEAAQLLVAPPTYRWALIARQRSSVLLLRRKPAPSWRSAAPVYTSQPVLAAPHPHLAVPPHHAIRPHTWLPHHTWLPSSTP
jgi:hypothetical protein